VVGACGRQKLKCSGCSIEVENLGHASADHCVILLDVTALAISEASIGIAKAAQKFILSIDSMVGVSRSCT